MRLRQLQIGVFSLLIATAVPRVVHAKPPERPPMVEKVRETIGEKLVARAREELGVAYKWNGRKTAKNPGLDCLGLMFLSLQKVTGISWTKWKVNSSELIPQLNADKDAKRVRFITIYNNEMLSGLKEGDFIFILSAIETRDKPVATRERVKYWVEHTAIYSGNGKIIHASPFDNLNKVIEEPFIGFMERQQYTGYVAVTPKIN